MTPFECDFQRRWRCDWRFRVWDRNSNRSWLTTRRESGAIADLVSAACRATARPPPRRCASRDRFTMRGRTKASGSRRRPRTTPRHRAPVPRGCSSPTTRGSSSSRPSPPTTSSASASGRCRSPLRLPSNGSVWKKPTTGCGRSTSTRSCWPRSTNAIASSRGDPRGRYVVGLTCQS